MLMRWTLGLAIAFALLGLLARMLQFAFSVALLAVAAIALVAALGSYLLSRGRGGPPSTTGRP